MLDTNLLHTILGAYDLDQSTSIEQIHIGTNRVYRFNNQEGSDLKKLAVKISKLSSERSIYSKHAEKLILDRIRPMLSCIPELIEPSNKPAQATLHSWGLLCNDNNLVSAYQWTPSQPYRGLHQQLTQVGKTFIKLQKALSSINIADLQTYLREPGQQRFKFSDNGLVLDDNFTFMMFEKFINKHAAHAPPCSLVQDNFKFLENEIEDIRRLIQHQIQKQSQTFNTKNLSLVHLELSPPNFGFNKDHTVAVIYDFDSVNYGVPLQDTGWLCATFCVDYRKSLHKVTKDLTTLLSAIQTHLPTDVDWHDLLLPFMRLGYLDAIYRKLQRAYDGVDTRMGFVKEDILCLRWLRQHDLQLESHIQQLISD
jgi:Ser/Thr protein kinase RdoA (MazF antagonist)